MEFVFTIGCDYEEYSKAPFFWGLKQEIEAYVDYVWQEKSIKINVSFRNGTQFFIGETSLLDPIMIVDEMMRFICNQVNAEYLCGIFLILQKHHVIEMISPCNDSLYLQFQNDYNQINLN